MEACASTSDLVCASTPQQCQHHCIGLDGQCITHPRSHKPVCMPNAPPTASNVQVSSIRHKLQVAPWQAYRQLQHAKTARTSLRHSPYHKCGFCRSLGLTHHTCVACEVCHSKMGDTFVPFCLLTLKTCVYSTIGSIC